MLTWMDRVILTISLILTGCLVLVAAQDIATMRDMSVPLRQTQSQHRADAQGSSGVDAPAHPLTPMRAGTAFLPHRLGTTARGHDHPYTEHTPH